MAARRGFLGGRQDLEKHIRKVFGTKIKRKSGEYVEPWHSGRGLLFIPNRRQLIHGMKNMSGRMQVSWTDGGMGVTDTAMLHGLVAQRKTVSYRVFQARRF